ncbi:homocysteine S-methyltransferase [Nocardia sp. alder85J]|uniref:homocysteine S-methyltransferase n=1 Tax=Nocardia sp. alder85J TaxID=2862949 RepID=UPI001CD78523|nr:homocysteine S-methyltransferase [Nocardia sp. alder85J]MCX4092038.1 homocysteine S-methyltransferase [Nocardia sp. alder85J]
MISDGGLATELEARGHDLSDALWSARLLLDDPEAIRAVHTAYFRAGARIATTASYQASFEGFAVRGLDRVAATRLLARSVTVAREARDAADDRPRWVAASIGPYGAMRADGSEYRGRYGLSSAALRDWHRPRLAALLAAEPDLLALETIPDVDEAVALVELVAEAACPAWLSYTIDGDRTRAGQPLAEAFAVAASTPQVVAVGVNCCHPADVAPAITAARAATGKPVVVYPNSGEGWDAHGRRWTGASEFSESLVREWISLGTDIIGGCCRVGPADIARLARISAGAG